MDNFAFIIHPVEPQKDVARKFPLLGRLPPAVIDYFCRFFPPVRLSHITGIRSLATGKEIEGWLIACPLTPRRMLTVPVRVAYHKIIQTGRLAERLGAQLLGLGAYTSVVGDGGITIARSLRIPVTTGNSFTISVTIEAALEAARRMDLEPAGCVAAVVGAYGSIGRACSRLLARSVSQLLLVGRKPDRLQEVQAQIEAAGGRAVATTDLAAIRQADIVLAVTTSLQPIIEPEHLKPGAVVCDVARPRNVSRRVAALRDDLLVIEGGVVELPGAVDFGFDFGLPPGQAYGCMAETAALVLEGRFESYSLGREISLERVEEMARMAARHGIRLAGFRSFGQPLSDEQIEETRKKAHAARKHDSLP